MANRQSSLKLNIPVWIKEITPSPKKYLDHLFKAMAFSKMQEYQRKQEPFKSAYKQDFPAFEKKLKTLKKEDFKKWDDYIIWKGIYQAYQKWLKRYQLL